MYEARQNKEKISRRIEGGKVKRHIKMNSSNVIKQMMSIIKSGFPDYEYEVERSDYKNGTDTTLGTQQYVNGPNFNGNYYPGGTVDLKYEVNAVPINSFTGKAVEIKGIPNPKIQLPNRSIWDAGHALPKQIGGIGDGNAHVFPQSPPVNQGNNNTNYNINPIVRNYQLWRAYEASFCQSVSTLGHGRWNIHVN